jgi:hypothetical protein
MTPLDLEIKQHIREFMVAQMNTVKHRTMPLSALPAIIIKEVDMERFIDELWVHINRRKQDTNDGQEN